MSYRIAALFCIVLFYNSCFQKREKESIPTNLNTQEIKDHLLNANKIVVKKESERIADYVNKHGWTVTKTGTGLSFMIYKNGEGKIAVPGNIISLKADIEMIDSTVCYKYSDIGPIEFAVNQSDQIRGLHELALHLKKGDKVKAILPPHLAYGLTGDNGKIPSKAILVYDIEVLNIQ